MTTKQNSDGAKEEWESLKKKKARNFSERFNDERERLEAKRHVRIYKAEDSLILNLLATFKGRTFRVQ